MKTKKNTNVKMHSVFFFSAVMCHVNKGVMLREATCNSQTLQAIRSSPLVRLFGPSRFWPLRFLMSSTKMKIRKECCWLLSNICAGPLYQVQQIRDHGFFERLPSVKMEGGVRSVIILFGQVTILDPVELFEGKQRKCQASEFLWCIRF